MESADDLPRVARATAGLADETSPRFANPTAERSQRLAPGRRDPGLGFGISPTPEESQNLWHRLRGAVDPSGQANLQFTTKLNRNAWTESTGSPSFRAGFQVHFLSVSNTSLSISELPLE